ncbi:MAG: DUF3382 domain-containing protein, partial [Alphaproteobacteria bacterium]|nr:DUF3382 domain-containing protein [Alphaproteobacteria bacterium]
MTEAALSAPRRGFDLPALLKEAAVAAVVALALAFPLVGFETITAGDDRALRVDYRFDWVLIGAAAVFLGRLALGLARAAW